MKSRKSNPAKSLLIQKSAEAKAFRQKLIETADSKSKALLYASFTINDILLQWYQEETKQDIFHTFSGWKEKDYIVKKGEKSFRIWGKPRNAKATTEMENVETGDTENIEHKYQLWPMACLFHAGQVEPIDKQPTPTDTTPDSTDTTLQTTNSLSSDPHLMRLGERVETLYYSKKDGKLGQYLSHGNSSTDINWARVKVDGSAFLIQFCNNFESLWLWRVTCEQTGKTITRHDQYSLVEAVEESAEPVIKKNVNLGEFRQEIASLERLLNYDRKCCSNPTERVQNFEKITRKLYQIEGLQCKTSTPEDYQKRQSVLSDVRRFLGLIDCKTTHPTEPPQGEQAVNPNPKTAAKLRRLAAGLNARISQCFADRLENTPKRIKQAAVARHEGQRLKRTQQALVALAELHDSGKVPPLLQGITSKKAVYELVASKVEEIANGYHSYSVKTGEPAQDSAEARELWLLLQPMTEEEKQGEALKTKIAGLQFASIPGYFPTPSDIAEQLIEKADITEGMHIIEPSAGSGNILDTVRQMFAEGITIESFEINATLSDILTAKGYNCSQQDFLSAQPSERADVILMNPPFEGLADIEHVQHAFKFLKPGGRLVSVLSPGGFFRKDKKAIAFRGWFKSVEGIAEDLPESSFKSSGTNVATKVIVIDKPAPTKSPFVRSDYESNLQQKQAYYEDKARDLSQQANQLHRQASKMASVIPFGQPILVGHHSEHRDRNYRAKFQRKYDQSMEASQKAGHYQGKAATVGKGGIASDDPEALEKIRSKLQKLEALQEKMVSANKAIRKNDDVKLQALGFDTKQINLLKTPDFCGRIGFADYQLANNRSEIRRLRQRYKDIQMLHNSSPLEFEDDFFSVCVKEGRIRFDFKNGKPSGEIRNLLKECGFHWSRSSQEWIRKATTTALHQSERMVKDICSLAE